MKVEIHVWERNSTDTKLLFIIIFHAKFDKEYIIQTHISLILFSDSSLA